MIALSSSMKRLHVSTTLHAVPARHAVWSRVWAAAVASPRASNGKASHPARHIPRLRKAPCRLSPAVTSKTPSLRECDRRGFAGAPGHDDLGRGVQIIRAGALDATYAPRLRGGRVCAAA